MIFKIFTSHPRSVGESYWQHFGFAVSTGGVMILGGLACVLHGVFPFLFTRTGSKTITRLHARISAGARHDVMEKNRRDLGQQPAE